MNESVVKFIVDLLAITVFVALFVFIPLGQAFALNVLLPAVFSLPYNFTTWAAIIIFNYFWLGRFGKVVEALINRNTKK